MPDYTDYSSMVNNLASRGRNGDTMLMHVNPIEVEYLSSLAGGPLPRNPDTGLPEAFPLLLPALGAIASGLSAVGPGLTAVLAPMIGPTAGGLVGSTIGALPGLVGSGLGSLVGGGSTLLSAIPGGVGGLGGFGGIGGTGSGWLGGLTSAMGGIETLSLPGMANIGAAGLGELAATGAAEAAVGAGAGGGALEAAVGEALPQTAELWQGLEMPFSLQEGGAQALELGAEQLPTLGGDVGQSLLQGLGEVGGQLGSGTTPGDLTASAVQEGYSGLAQQAAQPGAWDALQAIGSWAGKNPELVLGGGYGISQLVPPEDEPPWWEGGGEGGYEGEASWADRERQYYGGDMGSYGPEFDYFT